MAFTLDRNEAAERLGVSTRTIDRHIQANRIRTKRVGKKTFLDEDDIEALALEMNTDKDKASDYVVVENTESSEKPEIISMNQLTHKNPEINIAIAEFSRIYNDAQELIVQKDQTIQDLSYKLGKAESALNNSVNLKQYQETAFLLKTAQTKVEEEKKVFGDKIVFLEKEVHKKNTFIVSLVILFVVIIAATFIFFLFQKRLV